MTLKTPAFWYRPAHSPVPASEKILGVVSALYKAAFQVHHLIKSPAHVGVPVLCIGNIVAGGTGKTPTSLALLETIKKHALFKNPHFLIRGYGGAEMGPLLVDLKHHSAWDVGDEALILAQRAPTVIGGDRVASAQLAVEHGADVLILDDGLQNPGIYKDIKLVVINGEMGFGNGKLMPAGPLRQSLDEGLGMADGFILIGEDIRGSADQLPADKLLIHASLQPSSSFAPDKSEKYLAFAGLGYPKKFFTFLKELGLDVVESIAFSDHHPYDLNDLTALHTKAGNLGARLITTEKDFLRLPKTEGIEIETVPVDMVWDHEADLVSLIRDTLNSNA